MRWGWVLTSSSPERGKVPKKRQNQQKQPQNALLSGEIRLGNIRQSTPNKRLILFSIEQPPADAFVLAESSPLKCKNKVQEGQYRLLKELNMLTRK